MSLDTALHDLTLASNLNKMYSLINSLSCRQRYFAADSPTISKIDTITSVVYTAPNHEVHGSSYHIQGSLHDVVTMIRRVNQEYHYSDQYQKGNLEKLESSIIRAGNIYSGQVVVVAKTGKMEHMGDGVPEVEVSPKNQENIEMNQGKEGIEINQRKCERRVREAAIMASVMEKHASQEYHSTGIAGGVLGVFVVCVGWGVGCCGVWVVFLAFFFFCGLLPLPPPPHPRPPPPPPP